MGLVVSQAYWDGVVPSRRLAMEEETKATTLSIDLDDPMVAEMFHEFLLLGGEVLDAVNKSSRYADMLAEGKLNNPEKTKRSLEAGAAFADKSLTRQEGSLVFFPANLLVGLKFTVGAGVQNIGECLNRELKEATDSQVSEERMIQMLNLYHVSRLLLPRIDDLVEANKELMA